MKIKFLIVTISLILISCGDDVTNVYVTKGGITLPPDSCRTGITWICPEDSTHMHPDRACISCHKNGYTWGAP